MRQLAIIAIMAFAILPTFVPGSPTPKGGSKYNRFRCITDQQAGIRTCEGWVKVGDNGWCTPWSNGEGDLCYEHPSLDACKGASKSSRYYLESDCYLGCAKSLCQNEPKCAGYTYRKSDGRFKLKSKVGSEVAKHGNYECWATKRIFQCQMYVNCWMSIC